MTRRRLRPTRAVALMVAGMVAVASCSTSPPGVRVTDPRMPEPANGDVGVVYMTIHNTSGDADTLDSASSSAAGSASVHRTVRKGLVEEMLPDGPVTIAGGSNFVLHTGGSHLMLEHLRGALHVGDTVLVTLHFDRAGTVKVRVPVVDPVAATTGT